MKYIYILSLILLLNFKAGATDPEWLPNVLFDVQNFTNAIHCTGGVGYIHPFLSGGWINDSLAFSWFDANGDALTQSFNLDSVNAGLYYFEVRFHTWPEGFGYWFIVTIDDPGPIEVSFQVSEAGNYNIAQVDGSDGFITTEVTGGIQGYTYLWSNGTTTANLYNLVAGNYSVIVTDNTGCTASANITLTEPPSMLHVVSISSPVKNGTSYNVSSKGAEDGKINLTVSGGSPPYTYQWYPYGKNERNPDTLRAREYTVVVTDASGESISQKITLTEPEKLQMQVTAAEYTINSKKYNLSCNDCSNGSITASVSGGVAPFTYTWSSGQTVTTTATSNVISNLTAGKYVVYINDKNGSELKEGIELTAPDRDDWSMSGNGNTNPNINFIGTTDNKDLILKTSNDERIRITGDGKIKLDSVGPDTINAVYLDEHGILKAGPGGGGNQLCKIPAYAFYRKLCPDDNNYYFIGSNNSVPPSKIVIGNPSSLPGSYKLYVTGGILTEKLRVADASSSYWADFVFDNNYKLRSLSELSTFIRTNKHLPDIPSAEDIKNEGIDIAEIQGKLLQKIEELTLYLIKQQEEIDELKTKLKK